jgi:hypothetical protein
VGGYGGFNYWNVFSESGGQRDKVVLLIFQNLADKYPT